MSRTSEEMSMLLMFHTHSITSGKKQLIHNKCWNCDHSGFLQVRENLKKSGNLWGWGKIMKKY